MPNQRRKRLALLWAAVGVAAGLAIGTVFLVALGSAMPGFAMALLFGFGGYTLALFLNADDEGGGSKQR